MSPTSLDGPDYAHPKTPLSKTTPNPVGTHLIINIKLKPSSQLSGLCKHPTLVAGSPNCEVGSLANHGQQPAVADDINRLQVDGLVVPALAAERSVSPFKTRS
ncbi:hypothetical protein D3C80_1641240 [compost metagenome]